MVQIQELQEKVKSLNDATEFYDPETASSSGLSHVPSLLVSVPSPRALICRDSCLQSDTRNSFGSSGMVFEDDQLQLNHQQRSLEIREIWHQHPSNPCF